MSHWQLFGVLCLSVNWIGCYIAWQKSKARERRGRLELSTLRGENWSLRRGENNELVLTGAETGALFIALEDRARAYVALLEDPNRSVEANRSALHNAERNLRLMSVIRDRM